MNKLYHAPPVRHSSPFSIAPMMEWTDRHCRFFHRLGSRSCVLYTEMVVDQAILHGDRDRLLAYSPPEHPVICQLGGSDPDLLAKAAKIVSDYGYDAINLNVGCPSDRVKSGRFGACLMAEPERVAECMKAMQDATPRPVTVKCRIGIDDQDSYSQFRDFIDQVSESGCDTFIIHARKAILHGLSPKENREIPPLRYDFVKRLKQERPELTLHLNGGITSLTEAAQHLDWADGVMIGRAAYQTPALLAMIDSFMTTGQLPAAKPTLSCLKHWVNQYLPYLEQECYQGTSLLTIIRPALGLFHGRPGARLWKRILSENAYKKQSGPELVQHALSLLPDEA